jgi:FHA domain-containing protein
MTLTLLAVSLNEQPLSQPITACFDANGGTIGRADHNTMALPDPERHISRLQAEIIGTGSHYLIKNVGAANPIVIGNRTLVQGESTTLSDRDQVRIGGYLLQVVVDSEDDPRGADITRGRAAVAATDTALRSNAWPRDPAPTPGPSPRPAAAPSIGGMSDIATPLSSSNPFADLMGSPPAAPPAPTPLPAFARPAPGGRGAGDTFADLMPGPAGIPRGSQALGASAAAPPPARLPDDFDPFAAPPPARSDPLGSAPSRGGNPFDDLIPAAAPSSIDDVFGLKSPASGSDPLANFMAGLPPAGSARPAASPAPGGVSVDPLAMFGGSDLPAPAAAPSAANHTPDLLAGFVPPQVVPAPRQAMPVPQPAPPPATAFPPHTLPPSPFTQPAAPRSAGVPAPDVANPVLPTMFDWQMTPPAAAPVPAPPPVPVPAAAAPTPRTVAPGPYGPPTPTPPVGGLDLEFGFSQPSPPRAVPAPVPMAMPARAMPPAASEPTLPPAAPPAPAADLQLLLRAFCEGAGVEPAHMPPVTPELMQEIGAVLRAAIEGTLQLIAVRATTKHELRAAVTVIQARGNNPLKFAPDAGSGIEQLLRPTMRGFLTGPAAMTDAMNDLVGHSIGTVAGMRSALEGMLDRFAPQQLESKLVGSSLLDSVLPMNRKAKLWELYLQHFETIREEAQEDFHNLFGKAFLAAYEQQLERLKREGGVG